MIKIHTLSTLILLIISLPVFSQNSEAEGKQEVVLDINNADPQDSAAVARAAYEKRLKQVEAFRKGMEKDPKRFMDSLNTIRNEKLRVEALQRIEAYKSNPDLATLKEIDLSNAQLTDFPRFVFEARNAEVLILDGNSFSELPKELSQLAILNRIYWRNNNLDSKARIPRLEGIEKLDLSNNSLKRLPKVHRLEGLKELVLEDNHFTKIPVWRGRRLRNLEELDLSKNPLILGRRWYWLLNDIQILKLNKCEISEVHPSLYKMKGLEELQLQVNKLNTIPEGISRLEHLAKLSLYKNSIDSLPSDFFKLKRLEVIDLYYNKLNIIPSEISGLEGLKILYLSFNEIYDLPAEVGDLEQLRELYIHHNRISELPKNLANLGRLKVLHFQNNYIPYFPTQILDMESLVDLDISDTDITHIPNEIANMNLETFFWRHLEIDLNDEDQAETKEALIKLQQNGANVVPSLNLATTSFD
ncbi:leucine-rich repeat domain-containing protein [Ekhidna sp.]|uniref:leucine-rich repeat domain-containing protein n=1 Tax=Ekhidna sp. TaxID=2608089 RepID=UPI003C7CC38B